VSGLLGAVEAGELLTVLLFSGGRQSTAILHMILRGEIERPPNFVVLTADPGMEMGETYSTIADLGHRCGLQGIPFEVVEGPSLHLDLLAMADPSRPPGRLDTPPYWTSGKKAGSVGQLRQGCTKHYKIRPIDRAIRRLLEERHGISRKSKRVPPGSVVKWIGFTRSEAYRIKPPRQQYLRFVYPLIDLGMHDLHVTRYYTERGLSQPPRSVCNGCFSHGLDALRDLHDNRPEDWAQAVEVDEAIRDLGKAGLKGEFYTSITLKPLQELADQGFQLEDVQEEDLPGWSCDSGYCFT